MGGDPAPARPHPHSRPRTRANPRARQIIKTAPGIGLVSSAFFMLLPDRVYVFGDCAINVEPSAEDLADIAIASAHSARAFGAPSPRAPPPPTHPPSSSSLGC